MRIGHSEYFKKTEKWRSIWRESVRSEKGLFLMGLLHYVYIQMGMIPEIIREGKVSDSGRKERERIRSGTDKSMSREGVRRQYKREELVPGGSRDPSWRERAGKSIEMRMHMRV